jgi:hypothetical protein
VVNESVDGGQWTVQCVRQEGAEAAPQKKLSSKVKPTKVRMVQAWQSRGDAQIVREDF